MAEMDGNDPRRLYPNLITQLNQTMGYVERFHKQDSNKFGYIMVDSRTTVPQFRGIFEAKKDNLPKDTNIHSYKDNSNYYFIVIDDSALFEGYIYILNEKYNYFLVLMGRMTYNTDEYKKKCEMLQDVNKQHREAHLKHNHDHNHSHEHKKKDKDEDDEQQEITGIIPVKETKKKEEKRHPP